jgi:hypothetical protein
MQVQRSIGRSQQWAMLLGALALALSITLLWGCGDPARRDEDAAWKAVTAWVYARTPPGTQIRLTREASRIVKPGTIEIDLVGAASTGLKDEVQEMTATVVRNGQDWEMVDLYER